MIFTGSRTWGSQDEMNELTYAMIKLVGKHVTGLQGDGSKRERGIPPGPGLVIIQGGAAGLDTKVAKVARIIAAGMRRRSRAEFRRAYLEPELAEDLWLETYEADWDRDGIAAGGIRNQRMLDAGADQVLAFFAEGKAYGPNMPGGTNDMVRRAVRAGVPVDIYKADTRSWRKP